MKFMKFIKIVTHGGIFHADEILAIVTLYKLNVVNSDVPIERVFQVSKDDLENPNVLVLDIGGEYNPEMGNFDHHQNSELPATNLLVLAEFLENVELDLYKYLFAFYNAVSDTDKGITKAEPASFTQIVSNVNSSVGTPSHKFQMALTLVEKVLHHVWNVAEISMKMAAKWETLERAFNNKVVIQEDSEFIPNWKDLAAKEGITFLCCPNLRGGFQIVSFNSDLAVVPVSDKQTFRHASGFMAVYPSKEDALEHLTTFV